ncbi:MAG TPA: hypothetical protein VKV40_08300 [Ktedonobacteraceae bacterium]|nr:hypothetical protein [Ktedonobacteraceae bacterium]
MQQTQVREVPERISWARALIFAVGFFFIAALLIGQIPTYIYDEMTSSSLVGFEQGMLGLAAVCLGFFLVVQVIVLLFDPKPLIPPVLVAGLGFILFVGGLALLLWAVFTNHQYFPTGTTPIASVLGGQFLWFPDNSIDFVLIGATILGVGAAWLFYGGLAIREQRNPDRRDLGTTPLIRWLIIIAAVLLIAFIIFYTLFSDQGLANAINSGNATAAQLIIDSILNTVLAIAIFCTLGAFALRLHYLMRPVRKSTMSGLYLIGVFVAQLGVVFLLAWLLVYPAITWIHSWSFIGLGTYLTICARISAIPQSCGFSQQAGYIIDAVVTMNFFVLLMGASVIWRKRRNLVVIGGVTTVFLLAVATLLTHTQPTEILTAMLLCGGALILAAIWTTVARREFAIVGERNLGCLGMWLVVGTCLFVYLAAFAFFSVPTFTEIEPNVPFISGLIVPTVPSKGNPVTPGAPDAIVMMTVMIILAAIQFYFLARERYKV